VADSLFLVNTSTIDVVRIFEANGLYSPVFVTLDGVGVADETTSREEDDADDDTGGVGETELEDEVEEIFGIVEDSKDGGNGIR
jgi:hypothetical protein